MRLHAFIATTLLVANVALAEPPPLVLESNQAVIQVNGMVCSFCAHGATKALSKLDCLDRSAAGGGVQVDIDTHQITLQLRPDQKVPLRDIYQRIKNAGYDPVTFFVRSEGRLERSAGKLLLRNTRNGQSFSVVGGKVEGVPDSASITVQLRLDARQIPTLGAGGVPKATIDRLISSADKARTGG